MKEKTCKVCRIRFVPTKPLAVVCSALCAHSYAWRIKLKDEMSRLKIERKETRERKEKLKTRRDYLKEAQQAFNAFVRERDKGKPCICCGKPLQGAGNSTGGDFDCGHYRSVGSAPHLRFDERNAHGQTKQCNRWGAGRAVDYRLGLIQRIGREEVEKLEADNEQRKWSIEELKAIISTYKQRTKELKRASI